MPVPKTTSGDLLANGWLSPRAAADALGITVRQLEKRFHRGEINRRALAPGIYLYEVGAR